MCGVAWVSFRSENTSADFGHEVLDKHDRPTGELRPAVAPAVHEERDLIDVLRNRNTREQRWDVPASRVEFLLVSQFAPCPSVRVKRWLEMDQSTLLGLRRSAPDSHKAACGSKVPPSFNQSGSR